jgi:hypothetical protein
MEAAKCAACSQSFPRITTISSPSGEDVFFEAGRNCSVTRPYSVKYVLRSDEIADLSFAERATLSVEIS